MAAANRTGESGSFMPFKIAAGASAVSTSLSASMALERRNGSGELVSANNSWRALSRSAGSRASGVYAGAGFTGGVGGGLFKSVFEFDPHPKSPSVISTTIAFIFMIFSPLLRFFLFSPDESTPIPPSMPILLRRQTRRDRRNEYKS